MTHFSFTFVFRLSIVRQHVQFDDDDTSAIEATTRSLSCCIVKIIHDGKTYSDLLGKSKLPFSFLGRPFPNANAFSDIGWSFSKNHSRIFVYPESRTLFFLFFYFFSISIKKKSNILYHCYNNTFLHVQTFLTATSIDFDPGSAVKAYNEILNLNLNLNIRHF